MFILYQDPDLLIINKAAGDVVEGDEHSLESRLQKQFDSRLRALHRLDKGTSGVLAFSLRRLHHAAFVNLWEKHQVEKIYWVLVEGVWSSPKKSLESLDENSKIMKTKVLSVKTFETHSWLTLKLETGRKHQIRKQCALEGYPVLGDTRYGAQAHNVFESNFALHARSLKFVHPVTKQMIFVEADKPAFWNNFKISF